MVQIQELNDSLRRSKEMSKEVISARRAAKEAVEDMAEQNAKLIQAYLEKKKEIKEVWAHCSAKRTCFGALSGSSPAVPHSAHSPAVQTHHLQIPWMLTSAACAFHPRYVRRRRGMPRQRLTLSWKGASLCCNVSQQSNGATAGS